ncbi:MAG TPA: VIT domain-containing protein [Terracidiphilus sp.]
MKAKTAGKLTGMRRFWGMLSLLLVLGVTARADTGVLVPMDRETPDPSILSLTEMSVEIRIDNGDARVWMRQIFTNHTGRPQEGNYEFALPSGTKVSDFAVWDGPVRIPAVVLERTQAGALYQALKSQEIDPGLLQQGERTAEEAGRSPIFSVHIVPIPAWGTKRLEIEYHQRIPVNARKSYFVLPIKPDAFAEQHVARLEIHFELDTAAAIQGFAFQGKLLPIHIDEENAHLVRGTAEANNVNLGEDFAATWSIDEPANALRVITYRNPHPTDQPIGVEAPAAQSAPAAVPGYFEAMAQLSAPPAPTAPAATGSSGRTVVVLMDISLSMQWEKLERSYAAAAKLLQGLGAGDRFNLLLFNTGVESFKPAPVGADSATVMAAMNWLRTQPLRGGTDLQKALDAGLAQATGPDASLVLLTDGGANRGTIQNRKLAEWYAARWRQIPVNRRPKTDIFAVGDDANIPLLRTLSQNDGAMEQVLSTEPVDYKLAAFLSEVGHSAIQDLTLNIAPSAAVSMVYPLDDSVFSGGQANWVGQYARPVKKAKFRVQGRDGGQTISTDGTAELPAEALEHDQLPRQWAWARVQALLDQITRNGETDAAVNEVIRLAKQYKFVTPYTSFLAAPRALLRPRVIQPGDPLLRVHTDPAIVSVIALFPFGLEKPLRYLPEAVSGSSVAANEHSRLWETRFLAPPDITDGVYTVRLILRDRNGQVYRESKTFVIDSTPPTVRVHLDAERFRAGESVPLRVSASPSTRTIVAEIEGLAPAYIRWNPDAETNTGSLWLPPGLPAGVYTLHVTAEDVAHNLGSAEVRIEVGP